MAKRKNPDAEIYRRRRAIGKMMAEIAYERLGPAGLDQVGKFFDTLFTDAFCAANGHPSEYPELLGIFFDLQRPERQRPLTSDPFEYEDPSILIFEPRQPSPAPASPARPESG